MGAIAASPGCGAPTQGGSHDQVSRIIVAACFAALLPVGAWAGPVNINTADAKTLARELDGIGPAKAQAIVDYRQKNGAFKTADDLLKVEGIGAKVLEQNRDNIRVEKGGGEASGGKKAAPRPRRHPRRSHRTRARPWPQGLAVCIGLGRHRIDPL